MLKMNEYVNKNEKLDHELKKSYLVAKKNQAFLNLIDKLNAPEELLMQYTSRLEDSAAEYENCMKCKGLLECSNQVEGYACLPVVENGFIDFKYRPCKYRKKLDKETSYLKNIYAIDIPEAIKNARMKDIYTDDKARYDVIKYLKTFIDNPLKGKGLYLHGNFGCGKTYLIVAALNELAKKDVKSAIIFWPEFLKHLKTLFNTNDGFEEAMNKVSKAPILLIDDIGAENTTAWGRDEILCPILQYRMDEGLKTFFTSNLTLEELEIHLSITKDGADIVKAKRIIERIKQLTTDSEMISKNLRK